MMKPTGHSPPLGFTLMEMVVSIVLLAIASAAVIVLYGGLFTGHRSTENTQEGALLVQSCAENINGTRKQLVSFFSTPVGSYNGCNHLPTLHNSGSGTTLSVTVSAPTTLAQCPATTPATCLQFVIHAQNNSVQTSPDTTLFFVQH